MRTFTAKENRFIGEMIESASVANAYISINMFNDIFQTGKVAFDSQAACLSFLCENGEIPSHDYMLGVYNKILERVMLLQYLEKEGLVYLVPMPSSMGALHQLGGIQKYSQRVQFPVNPSISSYLNRLMNEPLYVGETLKAYVANGFRTLDKMALDEAMKHTKIARWSMVVAIVALFISILLSRCDNVTSSGNVSTSGDKHSGDSYNIDSSKTNLTIPLVGIMGIMKNSIEPKLEATMNNTAEIKAKLCDTLNVKMQKNSNRISNSVHNNISNSQYNNVVNNNHYRHPVKHLIKVPTKATKSCMKMVRVNTCKDTVVAKDRVNTRL